MPTRPFLMYISDVIANRRIGNFMKLKYLLLCQIIQKSEAVCIQYSPGQMIDLINQAELTMDNDSGLRVYFATYQLLAPGDPGAATNNALIPPGAEDQLTLIYAPTRWAGRNTDDEENHVDTGHYFVLDPGTNSFVDLSLIDPSIFTRWTDYYYATKGQVLSTHFAIQETTKMWYEYRRTHDLKQYLSDPSNNIQSVTVFFASYHNSERTSRALNNGNVQNYNVAKKLTLVFSLDTNSDDGLYTSLDFEPRIHAQAFMDVNETLEALLQTFNGDTGVPCPPAVCV